MQLVKHTSEQKVFHTKAVENNETHYVM